MKYILATTSVVALLVAGPVMSQTSGTQTNQPANQQTNQPADQQANQSASGHAGADITVKQPPPVVTVDPKAPNVTVRTEKPDVKVVQPPPKVTVTEAKPEVTVQTGEPSVKIAPTGKPDVTVVKPDGADREVGVGTTTPPGAPGAGGGEAVAPAVGVFPMSTEVEQLMGKNVYGMRGEELGEIQNLLIGSDGRVRAAIIEFGGFLGIGDNEVAVPWDRLNVGGDRVVLNMTEEQVKAEPRWSPERPGEFAEFRPLR